MSIRKALWSIAVSFLILCQVGMMLLFNLLIIVWTPRKRIVDFYNILTRKPFSRDGKPPPEKWNDPSLGKHGFVHLKGIKLHYVVHGDEDKPLMIFLHSFLNCWYTWRHQIREFSKNYRVVAIDLRGYSLSDCPVGKSNYTMEKNATDIAEVIGALGYKDCILVGYGWGGFVAHMTAYMFPDKISKIILLNVGAGPAYSEQITDPLSTAKIVWPVIYAKIPYSPEFMLSFGDFKSFESIFSEHGLRKEKLTEEDIEVYKYALSQKGVIYAILDNYRNFTSGWRHFAASSETFDWNILIIYGTKDVWAKKVVFDASKKYFPNGVFKTVEGGTHYMNEDQPELINELINEFLNEGGNKE